ncbi:GLPGLI family protein [Faecalibacter sp. LW9]|uniref:GLPGLI family protein n=1 Tax=Faecalibacter sp. LW9 TaxID=3103144 RepID=UPI002AFE8506|nr:GLPGLI family protein [Faecalibacter sp. LW9]
MKQIIILLIIFLSNGLIAQNTFIYQFSAKENQNAKSGILADVITSAPDPVEYIYLVNEKKASFKPELKINNSQTNQIDLLKISVKSLGEYFYDYDQKLIENKIETSNKEYIVTSTFDDLHWIDTNESETINGYPTKKYITKRKEKGIKTDKIYTTTIWIDESYPQDIAPFGLMGLKGLIVKVNFNGRNDLILQTIETKKVSAIQPFKGKNRITKEAYRKMIDDKLDQIKESRGVKMDLKS